MITDFQAEDRLVRQSVAVDRKDGIVLIPLTSVRIPTYILSQK
jgi:hypothetical protein